MTVTPIWLTDEDSEIAGYKRAKVPVSTYGPDGKAPTVNQPNKSDCPSLVRAVMPTQTGPATIPVSRNVGSQVFNQGWLTDPLEAPRLTAGTWLLHVWASVDNVAANVGLQVTVSVFGGSSVVSATSGSLGVSSSDVALTTGAASPTQLDLGDRLLITMAIVDVGGTMVAGHNATVSYNGLYSRAEGDTCIICPDTLLTLGQTPPDDVAAIRTMLRDFSSQMGLSSSPQLDDWEVVRYVNQAVETYSVDRPYIATYLYSGDGNTFDFPLPPRWIWSVSRITKIEYPAAQQIPNTLEYLDWEIRDDALGLQPLRALRLRTIIPDNGTDNFYIAYSTRHHYDSEYTTIPREDQDAVIWLAASYCAMAISSKFAGATDSTIAVDAINYRDSQTKWNSVATTLKEMYINRVVAPDAATPVGSMQEWRPQNSTGQATLWHSRRVRRVFY